MNAEQVYTRQKLRRRHLQTRFFFRQLDSEVPSVRSDWTNRRFSSRLAGWPRSLNAIRRQHPLLFRPTSVHRKWIYAAPAYTFREGDGSYWTPRRVASTPLSPSGGESCVVETRAQYTPERDVKA